MAVSLSNLPADEVIGWDGRGTVSMPEPGKVQFANAAVTGFTALDRVSERFRGVSSGAAPISFSTEGDWGLHNNSTAGTVEVGYRGASAMDPFATSTEVLNVRDFKQDGDVSWSEAFQRCFDAFADLSFGERSGTVVIPYQSGGYTLHERVYLKELNVPDARRRDIIGYGAMLNCTAPLGGIAKGPRDPDTMLPIEGATNVRTRIAGISFSGLLDPSDLSADEEFGLEQGYRIDHNSNPQLYSGAHFNGVTRQIQPDESSVAVYTIFTQSALEYGDGYCDELTDLQFYNFGCGLNLNNTFGSLMVNCTARDCLYGFYIRNVGGTLTPGVGEFNTMDENKCCRVLGSTSPITGTPFAFRQADNHVFKYCSVRLDTGCAVPFNCDTNRFNVHTRARVDHVWIDVAGNYLGAVRVGPGADDMEFKIDNVICKEHKGPVVFYAWINDTVRYPHIRITNTHGMNLWETSGSYPEWDALTAYSIGDRVSHTAGPTTGKTATGDIRYGYVAYAAPGDAGVNVPYPHYCDFETNDGSYVIGDKCYYNGKIYVATSNNTGGDSYIDADTATTISERASGTYQGYVQLTFGSAHSYSVDHEVQLRDAVDSDYNKATVVLEVVDSTNIVVALQFIAGETSGSIRVQKRTTPQTDPYGYWDYDSDAVWAPQCQDVAVTSWQDSNASYGANNFSIVDARRRGIHIDGYYGTRPVEFANSIIDTGATARVLINGWNTTDGVWQSLGGTTIV